MSHSTRRHQKKIKVLPSQRHVVDNIVEYFHIADDIVTF